MVAQLDMVDEKLVAEMWSLLEPVIASEGLEVLEIEYRRESIGWVLRIFIDREGGVSVDDCAAVSRVAGDVLDAADLIPNAYHLEVSSPGLDRPLRKWEQFRKYIGDAVEMRTAVPMENRRNFKGVLREASPGEVVVECDGKEHTIPLALIERARLRYFESAKRRAREDRQ